MCNPNTCNPYFGYFGPVYVEQKPSILEQFALKEVNLPYKSFRMSLSGALLDNFEFLTQWQGTPTFEGGGGDEIAKDRNEIWHACYWP